MLCPKSYICQYCNTLNLSLYFIAYNQDGWPKETQCAGLKGKWESVWKLITEAQRKWMFMEIILR